MVRRLYKLTLVDHWKNPWAPMQPTCHRVIIRLHNNEDTTHSHIPACGMSIEDNEVYKNEQIQCYAK